MIGKLRTVETFEETRIEMALLSFGSLLVTGIIVLVIPVTGRRTNRAKPQGLMPANPVFVIFQRDR